MSASWPSEAVVTTSLPNAVPSGPSLLASTAITVPAGLGVQRLLDLAAQGGDDLVRALAGGARLGGAAILGTAGTVTLGVIVGVLGSAQPTANHDRMMAWVNLMEELAEANPDLELVEGEFQPLGLRDRRSGVMLIVPNGRADYRMNPNYSGDWLLARLAGQETDAPPGGPLVSGQARPQAGTAPQPDPTRARAETVAATLVEGLGPQERAALQAALAARYASDVASGARGAAGGTQADYERFLADLFNEESGWTLAARDVVADAEDRLAARALDAFGVPADARGAFADALWARLARDVPGATASQALNWLAALPSSPATFADIAREALGVLGAISEVDPEEIGSSPTGVRPDLPQTPIDLGLRPAPRPNAEEIGVTGVFENPIGDPPDGAGSSAEPPDDLGPPPLTTPPFPPFEEILVGAPSDAELSAGDRAIVREAIDAETETLAANPVTPSVYSGETVTTAMRAAQARGEDVALVTFDLNNFSTFDRLVGSDRGDDAIGLASDLANAAAARLNTLYADEGIRFIPARLSGDEMELLAVFDPPRAEGEARMPPAVPKDMLRVLMDQLQAYNAARATTADPIPTLTGSGAVIRPGDYDDAPSLRRLIDAIDGSGVALLNQGGSEAGFARNGSVYYDPRTGETQVLAGPTYAPVPGMTLEPFREMQGAVPWPTEDADNIRSGAYGRPSVIPGSESAPLETRVPLPGSVLDAVRETLLPVDLSLVGTLNALRGMASVEASLRDLAAEGVVVLDQPTALARLDGLIDVARADGSGVTLEFFEPRGLKAVNDTGYVLVDGERVPVSHGGGNVLIEAMVRANDAAARAVFGEDHARDVTTFRDRGKRFGNVFAPHVTPDQIRLFQETRAALYAEMPALYTGGDGVARPIVVGEPDRTAPFVFSAGYAALRLNPAEADPAMDARLFRDLLVAPLEPGGESLLDLGKNLADGVIGSREAMERVAPQPGTEIILPWGTAHPENAREPE